MASCYTILARLPSLYHLRIFMHRQSQKLIGSVSNIIPLLFCFLYAVTGALFLLAAVAILVAIAFSNSVPLPIPYKPYVITLILVVSSGNAYIFLLLACGFWRLEMWSRNLTLIFLGVLIASSVMNIYTGEASISHQIVVRLCIYTIAALLLLIPPVRRLFR
jgi:hypothetical protein